MITLVTGIPGSGKTYYSVYKIYKHFLEPYLKIKEKQERKGLFSFLKSKKNENHSDKYDICYTNINGFNFNLFDNRVKYFDFNSFYEFISLLHRMYIFDKATDDELIKKIKEYKYYKALIVIDESHNYFNKKNDDVLLWLLTYHRHLFIDIDMITQLPQLISKDYSALCQENIKAQPPVLRIFQNQFRYTKYLSSNFYKNEILSRFSIPTKKEIFSIYISGDDTKSKSFIIKFFILFLILFFIAFFGFNLFANSYKQPLKKNQNNNQTDISQVKQLKQSNQSNVNNHLNQFKYDDVENYVYYDVVCYDSSYCKINNNDYDEISYKTFMYLKEINTPDFFEVNRTQKSITKFNLIYKKDIFLFLKKKGLKNEKGVNSSMLPSF